RRRRWRRSAGDVLGDGRTPLAADGRLPARGRHHGRELLRPPTVTGLRLRGADLVPRRDRRPADARVRPRAAPAPAAGRAHRRRCGRPRAPRGLAGHPAGRPHPGRMTVSHPSKPDRSRVGTRRRAIEITVGLRTLLLIAAVAAVAAALVAIREALLLAF